MCLRKTNNQRYQRYCHLGGCLFVFMQILWCTMWVFVYLIVIVQTKNIRVGRKERRMMWWQERDHWCVQNEHLYQTNIFSHPLKWKRQRFKGRDCGHVYMMWFLESLFLELFKLFCRLLVRDCVLSSTFKSTFSHTKKSSLSGIFNMREHKRESKFDGVNMTSCHIRCSWSSMSFVRIERHFLPRVSWLTDSVSDCLTFWYKKKVCVWVFPVRTVLFPLRYHCECHSVSFLFTSTLVKGLGYILRDNYIQLHSVVKPSPLLHIGVFKLNNCNFLFSRVAMKHKNVSN